MRFTNMPRSALSDHVRSARLRASLALSVGPHRRVTAIQIRAKEDLRAYALPLAAAVGPEGHEPSQHADHQRPIVAANGIELIVRGEYPVPRALQVSFQLI